MASTTFSNGTVISSAWLTDVNGLVWTVFNGATTAALARTALGLGSLATLSTVNNSNWSGTALTVANGGTGLATLTTAYGVVCAGTTATGALQNTGAGTSPNVLTSNGAAAIPTFQQPAGKQLLGTATNDAATAGNVGEYLTATVASGSSIPLTTLTGTNVTSMSVTAGDWDISGVLCLSGGGTTVLNYVFGSVSTTSASLDLTPGKAISVSPRADSLTNNGSLHYPITTSRISLAGTTTVYLVAQVSFTTSTCNAYGGIFARRVR